MSRFGCAAALAAIGAMSSAHGVTVEESPLFDRHVDARSGVVSYILKKNITGYFNQQSLYFTTKSMTDDGRFLVFNASSEDQNRRRAFCADLERGVVFPLTAESVVRDRQSLMNKDGNGPWVDVATDRYYFIARSPDRVAFIDLRHPEAGTNTCCVIPKADVLEGFDEPHGYRYATHMTLTPDRRKAFFDARVWKWSKTYYGLLDLESGKWEKWGETDFNLNHGQLSPTDPDVAMCAHEIDWTDRDGVMHRIGRATPENPDFVYPRLQICTREGRRVIPPDANNEAVHEGWYDDGKGIYYCSRGVHDYDFATGVSRCICPASAAHATVTVDRKYVTFDHSSSVPSYRGNPWNVSFWNRDTERRVFIHENMPASATPERPSRLHPDPHPHFVMNGRYIVCTFIDGTRALHVSVTPVKPLVEMTSTPLPPLRASLRGMELDCAEPDTMAAWYVRHLGFEVVSHLGGERRRWVLKDSGGFEFRLCRAYGKLKFPDFWSIDPDKFCLSYASQNLEADVKRLKAAGCDVVLQSNGPGVLLRDAFGMPIRLVRHGGDCAPSEASGAFADLPQDADPASFARAAIEQLLSTRADCYSPRGYGHVVTPQRKPMFYGLVLTWLGALDAAEAMGDGELMRRLAEKFDPVLSGEQGFLRTRSNHVDHSVFGALPLAIYSATGNKAALALGLSYADAQWSPPSDETCEPADNLPREKQQELWEKGYTPQTRFWMDDMYMITVLQGRAALATGDGKYIDRAAREMCAYLDRLQLRSGGAKGLFHHAEDVPYVWGRGDGWMAAGMALLLDSLPEDSVHRPRIMRGYVEMMEALLRFQRPGGLWGQLVDDPESYDETSGSAMFAYAFVKGVLNGWLDASRYGAAARRAWLALCSRVDEYGNLRDVCIGTGKLDSREYYLRRPVATGDLHGQAPLLWTAAALLKVVEKPRSWLGPQVHVVNPVGIKRTETVSVPYESVGFGPDALSVRVYDVKSGKSLPWQDDGHGNIIFSITLDRFEKRVVGVWDDGVSRCIPSGDLSTVCWCDYVPERLDDYVWENDCFGCRAYGPAIAEPPPRGQSLVSSGIDVFCKSVTHPVLDSWLRYVPKGVRSYHDNRGEGMDGYIVGRGRGCGGIGARGRDGKWMHSANWSKARTIRRGPVRCEFELEYDGWGGLGREIRHVVLDRGQSFAKMTAKFENPAAEVLVGPGLDMSAQRGHGGDSRHSLEDGWVSLFEKPRGRDGSTMTAVVLDRGASAETVAMDDDQCMCLLVSPKARPGGLVYYAGANWTEQGRFKSADEWHAHVRELVFRQEHPVRAEVMMK